MCQDRIGSNLVPLTQEFLAHMLGTRRASVTVAAGILQKAGLITYSRGNVNIVDRSRLESACCECYQIMRQQDSKWRNEKPGD
jgi:Mn-dependent DtxR family transcriptional regulator